MTSVEEILDLLSAAKTDAQMIFALSCVPKFINIMTREKVGADWEIQLFTGVAELVPFDFFDHLINSDSVPSGCPSFMYKSVAFSVLSAILLHLVNNDKMTAYCHIIAEGVEEMCDKRKRNLFEPEDFDAFLLTVKDGLNCCRFLLLQIPEYQLKKEITKLMSMASSLSELPQLTTESLGLLQSVTEMMVRHQCYPDDSSLLDSFIHNVVKNVKADHSELAMESLRQLANVITVDLRSVYNSVDKSPVWTEDLLTLLFAVVQSRLKPHVKRYSIRIADAILDLFGFAPFQRHEQFFQLLLSITTVELKLLLDKLADGEARADQKHLLFCYCSVLERGVGLIRDETAGIVLTYSESQLLQMNDRLLDAVKLIGEFLVGWAKQLQSGELLNTEVIPPLFRFLCTYMAEDCTLLIQELKIGLPALLQITKWLTGKQSEFDAVGLMLPGLSHMTADEDLVKLLIDNGTFTLCTEYFRFEITKRVKTSGSHTEVVEIEQKLTAGLVVMLNLLIASDNNTSTANWNAALVDLFVLIGKLLVRMNSSKCQVPFSESLVAHLVAVQLQLAVNLISGDPDRNCSRLPADSDKVWPVVITLLRTHKWDPCDADSETNELWMFNMESLITLTKWSELIKDSVKNSGWYEEMFVSLRKATQDKQFDEMSKKFVSLLSAMDQPDSSH